MAATLSTTTKLIALTILTAFTIPLASRAYANYQEWKSLGPGGVPYNVLGWAGQSVLHLLTDEVLSTACYDDPALLAKFPGSGSVSFLTDKLPVREGERPSIGYAVAPQRELGAGNSLDLRKQQYHILSQLALLNPTILQILLSKLEGQEEALFLSPQVPVPIWAQGLVKGEIAHLHLHAEGSGHALMSLPDAKLVLDKGWGERHGLSGIFGNRLLPASYVMIYAPRNEAEVRIWGEIVTAACRAVAGGVELQR